MYIDLGVFYTKVACNFSEEHEQIRSYSPSPEQFFLHFCETKLTVGQFVHFHRQVDITELETLLLELE